MKLNSGNLNIYEKNGYKGTDASLEISLFEYGIIWKEIKPGEWTFIIGTDCNSDYDEYNEFDTVYITSDMIADSWFMNGQKFIDVARYGDFAGTEPEEVSRNFPDYALPFMHYYGIEIFY